MSGIIEIGVDSPQERDGIGVQAAKSCTRETAIYNWHSARAEGRGGLCWAGWAGFLSVMCGAWIIGAKWQGQSPSHTKPQIWRKITASDRQYRMVARTSVTNPTIVMSPCTSGKVIWPIRVK